jgi:hypothetical protein
MGLSPGDGSNANVMTYPSSIRGAYFRNTKDAFVCAEPPPDTAAGESMKVAFNALVEAAQSAQSSAKDGVTGSEGSLSEGLSGKGEASGSVERTINIVNLDGRSELVLVVRESLYRVCEATYNDPNMETKDRIDLYKTALKGIQEVASAIKASDEAKTAAANQGKAEAELKKLEATIIDAELKSLVGGDRIAAELLARTCIPVHASCTSNAKDDATKKTACDEDLKKCVQEKLKMVKG